MICLPLHRALALIAFAVIVACKRDEASQASPARSITKLDLSDPIDSVTGVAASCEFVKTPANPDPQLLIADFARRGAEGEFLQTDEWFNQALDCPGHVTGWDSYDVVGSYAVGNATAHESRGSAVVTYKRIGIFGQGADPSRPNTSAAALHVDTVTVADTLILRRTQYGWRIAGQAPPPRVSYQAAFARGDLKAADTLRIATLLAQWW